MAFQEFDGELDAPVFKEFDGELDAPLKPLTDADNASEIARHNKRAGSQSSAQVDAIPQRKTGAPFGRGLGGAQRKPPLVIDSLLAAQGVRPHDELTPLERVSGQSILPGREHAVRDRLFVEGRGREVLDAEGAPSLKAPVTTLMKRVVDGSKDTLSQQEKDEIAKQNKQLGHDTGNPFHGAYRMGRDVSNDALKAFHGTASMFALNPDGEYAKGVRESGKLIDSGYSPERTAGDESLSHRLSQADGEAERLLLTLTAAARDPRMIGSEALKQSTNAIAAFLGARSLGALAKAGVSATGAAVPTVALSEAISGGTIAAKAQQAGTLLGGMGVAAAGAASDAGNSTHQAVMAMPMDVLWQNADFAARVRAGVAAGKPQKQAVADARNDVAMSLTRWAQAGAVPLAALAGGTGMERLLAGGARSGAGRAFGAQMSGEVGEELGTQFASNAAIHSVDKGHSLTEGFGETAARTMMGAGPSSMASAFMGRTAPEDVAESRNLYAVARAKGFNVSPPLTSDNPVVQREKTTAIFDGVAAVYGIPKEAVQKAKDYASRMPSSAIGGFYAKYVGTLQARGLAPQGVDADVLGTLTAGPVEEDSAAGEKPAKVERVADVDTLDASSVLGAMGLDEGTDGTREAYRDGNRPDGDGATRPVEPSGSAGDQLAPPDSRGAVAGAAGVEAGAGLDSDVSGRNGGDDALIAIGRLADAFEGRSEENASTFGRVLRSYERDLLNGKIGAHDVSQQIDAYTRILGEWDAAGQTASAEPAVAAANSPVEVAEPRGESVEIDEGGGVEAKLDDRISGNEVEPTSTDAGLDAEPSTPAKRFEFIENKDGTVLVKGDAKQVADAFHGIKGIAGKRGVTFGRTKAKQVIEQLERDAGAISPKVGFHPPPETVSAPLPAAQQQQAQTAVDAPAPSTPDGLNSTQQPKPKATKPVRGSQALGQVSARLGGLSQDMLADLSSKVTRTRTNLKTGKKTAYTTYDNPPHAGHGPLFRKGGTADMSEVARVLEEGGYIEPGLSEREPLEAIRRAEEIIKGELARGGSTLRVGDADAVEAEMRGRAEAAMGDPENGGLPDDFFDGLTSDDLAETEYASASEDVRRATELLMEHAEAEGIDTEALRDDAARQTEGQSDDDYHIQVQRLAREALAARRRSAGEPDASPARAGSEDRSRTAEAQGPQLGEPAEGLTLEAQTIEDLKAKTERETTALEEEKKAEAAAQAKLTKEKTAREVKARVDATVDDFQLGQSAEQQVSGQGSIFDAQQESQKPARPAAAETSGARPAAPKNRKPPSVDAQVELRKRISVLKSLKECLG